MSKAISIFRARLIEVLASSNMESRKLSKVMTSLPDALSLAQSLQAFFSAIARSTCCGTAQDTRIRNKAKTRIDRLIFFQEIIEKKSRAVTLKLVWNTPSLKTRNPA